ncbi:MAG TPA: Gfo/Idh/MocA family oxidoreductase [Nitrospiraceae bacterium]|nr:Gfo/Idh/MocA family oxidoreductase [Nitrospiraceae bacterium]
MQKLRVGVIGVGHLGQHHARLYAALPLSTLVGVTDQDSKRGQVIADKHRVRFYSEVAALLREVDAVSIAVPTSAHHAVAKLSLDAGVHVLVEKPITVTLAEATELIELAHRRACVLQVGHIERFNPAIRAVRSQINRPGFIECHRLSPFGERGTDVDVVLDLMIHDLDMVLSFHPGTVEEVRAAGVPVLSSTIDIANARIAFTSGCVANFTASRVSTMRMRKLRLFQRDSYLSVDYQARQAAILRRQLGTNQRPEIFVEPAKTTDDEPLKLELEAFLHAIVSKAPPVVSGEDGAAALALAHQVLESIGSFVQRHSVEGEVKS